MREKLLAVVLAAATMFTTQAQNKVYDFSFNNTFTTSVDTGTFSSTGTSFIADRNANPNSALYNSSNTFTQTATLANLPTGHSARTISLWFNRTGGGNVSLVSYGALGAGKAFDISFHNNGALQFFDGSTVHYMNIGGVSSSTWHHLVITYNETTVIFYLNGNYGDAIVKNLNTSNSVLRLGNMVGYYDDLQIYEGALTAAQITALYNNSAIQFDPAIAVTANPTSGGIVTGTGVYSSGSNATLTAIPVTDATFINWEENGVEVSTDSIYTFAVSGNRHLVANFMVPPVVYIPDATFKAYLTGQPFINTNSDADIQVSEAQALTSSLDVSGYNISDLTGIEAFVNITGFSCSYNVLTSLDLSSNTAIQSVDCSYNQLTSLDLSSNTAVQSVDCSYNQLTSLNMGNNTVVTDITCSHNQLISLDFSGNTALINIYCTHNDQLTSLDLSNNAALTSIQCKYNDQLTSLDLSNNAALTYIDCSNNSQLASLNVANGSNTTLFQFYAQNNPSLTCVEVDDAAYSTTNWTGGAHLFDAGISFSEDCAATTAVSAWEVHEAIRLYPNPAGSTLHLEVEGVTNVKIINTLGATMSTHKLEAGSNNSMDVSNLAKGVYFLQTDKGRTLKFIKA